MEQRNVFDIVLKFFTMQRFNRIDILGAMLAGVFIVTGDFVFLAATIVVGPLLSTIGERVAIHMRDINIYEPTPHNRAYIERIVEKEKANDS